jgi:DNA-binding NarL/FixJ family response regulator
MIRTPKDGARAQLRTLYQRLEEIERQREMLLTLRALAIIDASRRGLSQEEIGQLLGGLTKQRVGQIAAQGREATRVITA